MSHRSGCACASVRERVGCGRWFRAESLAPPGIFQSNPMSLQDNAGPHVNWASGSLGGLLASGPSELVCSSGSLVPSCLFRV